MSLDQPSFDPPARKGFPFRPVAFVVHDDLRVHGALVHLLLLGQSTHGVVLIARMRAGPQQQHAARAGHQADRKSVV